MSEQSNKPGYATTEFWVTLITVIAGFAVSQGWLSAEQVEQTSEYAYRAHEIVGIIAAGLASAAYTVGRSIAKS